MAAAVLPLQPILFQWGVADMYRIFSRISYFMAYAGAAMLAALIGLIVLSVVGRIANGVLHSDFFVNTLPDVSQWLLGLGIGPINGDFELVKAGVAFSIFAFLPVCHLTAGHAVVDVFSNNFPVRTRRILTVVTEIAFAFFLVVVAIQLEGGMQTKLRSGETTLLLEMPIWWSYGLSLFAVSVSGIVGVFIAGARVTELLTGRIVLKQEMGSEH